jgi:hypothetical protein
MQNPKPSPLLELVAKKKLAQQEEQAVQTELPFIVGTPASEPAFDNRIATLLQSVMSLSKQVNNIITEVQVLATEIDACKASEHTPRSLGIGNIAGAKWRTEHAIELLVNYTKKPWTKNKLLALSVTKGWRSAERGHKPANHMFVTTIVSKQYPQPVVVYTELALQHIVNNVESCWSLATKVKI